MTFATKCHLNIPHKDWARDQPQGDHEFQNLKAIEDWAGRWERGECGGGECDTEAFKVHAVTMEIAPSATEDVYWEYVGVEHYASAGFAASNTPPFTVILLDAPGIWHVTVRLVLTLEDVPTSGRASLGTIGGGEVGLYDENPVHYIDGAPRVMMESSADFAVSPADGSIGPRLVLTNHFDVAVIDVDGEIQGHRVCWPPGGVTYGNDFD